ncbi:hypothetical protein AK812_SmicGene39251 [Symbiodinium microadriaticum]|uniref:Uncharacterized protein n=1 Tax=Symbiodinium microadriaticum TaxID=2951 RepID=A0A1Q9CBP5_SYMMI|nr:hypothetical protein AK812_SmicGene39251 [Symbiodinium microadriaticum]
MIVCLGLAVLLSTVGQAVWRESKPEVLSHLEPLDQVLSRWDLSSEFVWDQLNRCISFLSWSLFAHGMLVLTLLLVTIPFSSALGWVLRIIGLTLLDGAYAVSGLQLAKLKFAHAIEGRAKDTWEGWLVVHGGLDYMRSFVSGEAGPAFVALVHWFLDDKAAVCNGLCIGRHLVHELARGAAVKLCGIQLF